MLDFMDKNAENAAANECMEKIYSMTLHAFHSSNNERLWLKTNTKLARLWLDQHDYRRLADKVRELHKACQTPDGQDDPTKGTYSHEVYALEIAMYAETRNLKRMKVSLVHVHLTGILTCARHYTRKRYESALPYLTHGSWALFENVVERCT